MVLSYILYRLRPNPRLLLASSLKSIKMFYQYCKAMHVRINTITMYTNEQLVDLVVWAFIVRMVHF